MTTFNISTDCPRCELRYGEPSYEQIQFQIRNCRFCAKRYINGSKGPPNNPTKQYPTWQPSDGIR